MAFQASPRQNGRMRVQPGPVMDFGLEATTIDSGQQNTQTGKDVPMAVKPKVFVTRLIPDAGLNRIKEQCDAEVWTDPLPPPHAVLRQKVAGCDGLVSLLADK